MNKSIAFMLCFAVIFIDFTSKVLSITVDAVLLLTALYLLKDLLFPKGKSDDSK